MTKLSKITKLSLHDFRGWGAKDGAPREVAISGDVVLVTGANGHGKSSLIEALVLLLSGHRIHRPASGTGVDWSQLAHNDATRWRLAFEGQTLDQGTITGALTWNNPGDPVQGDDDPWARARASFVDVKPELLAAGLAFVQEEVRSHLDDGQRSQTLSEWFQPLSKHLNDLRERLPVEIEQAKQREHFAKQERQNFDEVPAGLEDYARQLEDALKKFLAPVSLAEEVPDLATALREANKEPLRALVEKIQARAPGEPSLRAPSDTGEQLLAALRSACQALDGTPVREQRELKRKRDLLTQQLAQAERNMASLKWAGLEDLPEPPPLAFDELLATLARFREDWVRVGRGLDDPLLTPVLDELERLSPARLDTLSETLRATLGRAREAKKSEEALSQQLQALQSALSQERQDHLPDVEAAIESLTPLLRLREERAQASRRLQGPEVFAEVITNLQRLETALKMYIGASTGQLEALFTATLDNTLFRFLPRPGLLPIRRDSSYEDRFCLIGADGRPWSDFSTGEKAQLALGLMLAYALALRDTLPAQVLLLDDTSTAFDLGNLVRQASWLRQLAYHPEPQHRWQLIMVSHHDELTSRLVELLAPPGKRTLQVLEFRAFTPGFGPEVASYHSRQLETHRLTGDDPERLTQALQLVWSEPLITRGFRVRPSSTTSGVQR